ncbi:MAG: hypothetical protein ACO2PO_14150 [Candidatus Calescibacterium sp.]|jgi:hypothetical protein
MSVEITEDSLREFLKTPENREMVFKILFELMGGWRRVERLKCPRCGEYGNWTLNNQNGLVFWHWDKDKVKRRRFCYIGKLRRIRTRPDLEIVEEVIEKIIEGLKKEKGANLDVKNPPNATKTGN